MDAAEADPRSRIAVEVAYARADEQALIELRLAPDCTVIEAIRASGILERYPEIDLEHNPMGVFGRVCAPHARLGNGDRVEIYRPLRADPKALRRRRAVRPS